MGYCLLLMLEMETSHTDYKICYCYLSICSPILDVSCYETDGRKSCLHLTIACVIKTFLAMMTMLLKLKNILILH
jgi:hypothetical protein